jgi:hypothetical protein
MNARFVIFAFAACAAALAGCQLPTTPEEKSAAAEKQCQTFRSYRPARAYVDVLESCSRQLGEAYCRKCLGE